MLKSTFLWVLVPDIASTPPAVLPSSPPERHRDDSKMCSSLSGPPAAPTPPRSRVLVEGSPHFWDWLIRPPTCGHPSPLAAPAGNHQRGRFKCTIYWSVNEGKQVKRAVHNVTERTWASYRKNKWSSCLKLATKKMHLVRGLREAKNTSSKQTLSFLILCCMVSISVLWTSSRSRASSASARPSHALVFCRSDSSCCHCCRSCWCLCFSLRDWAWISSHRSITPEGKW